MVAVAAVRQGSDAEKVGVRSLQTTKDLDKTDEISSVLIADEKGNELVLGDLPKNLWVSRVTASKFSDGRAYVTVDGHRSNDMKAYVYMTDDFGKTWTNLSAGLPDNASLYAVQEGQKNQDLVLVGSETGFHISLDRGKTWTKFNHANFPTVPVYDLQIHPRDLDLIIATHGRAIWTMNIAGLEQIGQDDLKADADVFKPKDVLLLGWVDDGWFSGEQDWLSPNNQPGTEIPYFLKADASTEPDAAPAEGG